jgi:hypothetical protein
MQKAIRRSMEREAMQFACELLHTGKAFHWTVCNRLEVKCHENLDTIAAPQVASFVSTALAQSRGRCATSIREAPADGAQRDPHHVPVTEVPCPAMVRASPPARLPRSVSLGLALGRPSLI